MEELLVLAQTASDVAPWAGLGVAAILGWYLFYKTTVSEPNERKEHRQHVESITQHHERVIADHVKAMKEIKDEHLKIIKEIRDECRYEREQFLTALQTERALFAEAEERRAEIDKQRHKEQMALAAAMNRIAEMIGQRFSNGGPFANHEENE